MRPLVDAGIAPRDYPASCYSLTGYSGGGKKRIAAYYKDERFVRVLPYESEAYLEDGFFNLMQCNHTNDLDIFVFGHNDFILLVTRFDNLGKGASGAAIQNMNLMLGFDEAAGLE